MPDEDQNLDAYKPDVLQSGFSLHVNEDKSNAQASESYSVRAEGGNVLGAKGEVRAFAKPQLDVPAFNELHQRDKVVDAELAPLKKESANFKAWSEKQRDLIGLPESIQRAENEVKKSQASLEAAKAGGNPQQIEMWENNVAGDQEKLDGFLKWQENQSELENEIAELAKKPDVARIIELEAEKVELTAKLKPTRTIAETSAPLFKEKEAMVNDPAKGGDRALLARSVATHQVDQLLGTNVIAEEKMAQSGDKLLGVSVQADGAQIAGKHEGKDCFLQANYADPRIQKGMCDLEAVDYITGQIDRHYGNVFIEPESGKVTGIDNDLAFPEQNREVMIRNDGAVEDKVVKGMPKMMSSETADKILAIRPDQLENLLSSIKNPDGTGGLSKEEIQGAVTRLQELQNAIKDPNSGVQVVKEFNQETYNTLIQQQREQMVQDKPYLAQDLSQPKNDFADVKQAGDIIKNTKASYLAGAVMEGRKYELQNGKIEEGVTYGLRDPGSAKKAQVDPAFAEYKKQEQAARQSMLQNPRGIEDLNLRREVTQLQAQKNDLQKQLDECQKKLDKMDGPASLRDKAKSLFNIGRGEDQKRQDLGNQKQELLQGLKAVQQQTDAALDKAVAPMQVDLRMSAKEKVAEQRAIAQAIAEDKANSVATKHAVLKKMAEENGVNPAMVELQEGEDGHIRSQKEMVNVGGNKQINTKTFLERSVALAEKSPAESKLALLKSERDAALGDAILKSAAVLHQGGPKINDVETAELKAAFKKVKEACAKYDKEEKLQDEQRIELYKQEVGAAVTPVLEQQGFSPQEIEVFVEASVALGMDMDSAALKNNEAIAKAFAGQLKDGLEQSDFKYSDHKPEASKLHDALYRANDTHAHVHVDGDIEIKRGHASFQEKSANKILDEVAAKKGVELKPANAQGQVVEDNAPKVDQGAKEPSVAEKAGIKRSNSVPDMAGSQWKAGEKKEGGKVDVRASLGLSRGDAKPMEVKQPAPAVDAEGQKAEGVEVAGKKKVEAGGQSKVKQMVAALEKGGQQKLPGPVAGGKSVGGPRK